MSPLRISPAKARMPMVLPAALMTFVAPIFPLPTFRGSVPLIFARRIPTGIEQIRYETGIHKMYSGMV
jgi:hypothetical protein